MNKFFEVNVHYVLKDRSMTRVRPPFTRDQTKDGIFALSDGVL